MYDELTVIREYKQPFMRIFFYILFKNFFISLSLVGNLGGPTQLRHSSRKSSTIYRFLLVCAVFPCSQTIVCLPLFGIFSVHLDVDARTFTLRLHTYCKVDFVRKIPCCTGDSNPHQYCTRLFSQTLCQLSYSPFGLTVKHWRKRFNEHKLKTFLFSVFSSHLISVPSFCYSRVCVCVCVCV